MLATFSCEYVSTGNWTIRFWIDGVFIDEQTNMNLTASNMHFQFGTGNSSDDRDGQHSFTHLQVDEYSSGDLGAMYKTNSNPLSETDNLYKAIPTEAYSADYYALSHKRYIKVGAVGDNTLAAWYQTNT